MALMTRFINAYWRSISNYTWCFTQNSGKLKILFNDFFVIFGFEIVA